MQRAHLRLSHVAQHVVVPKLVGTQQVTSNTDVDPVLIRFPHCGEQRLVSPPCSASLLGNLSAEYAIVTSPSDSVPGSAARPAFVLQGPPLNPGRKKSLESELGAGSAVSAGPLKLRAPGPGETVSDLARRLEDDGLLYLPKALSLVQIEQLKADFDNTPTDPMNPVDSGQGTPAHEKMVADAVAEGRDPGYVGNKGVMSFWNRDTSGRNLQYLDLDPCCAVAEATLGEDCHLIQQKAWSTGPGRPGQTLHVDFVPVAVEDEQLLVDGMVRMPIYLITAHYYLEDMTEELGTPTFPSGHMCAF